MKTYKLTLFAKGGHGAEPHKAIDATLMASEFIRKLCTYQNYKIVEVNAGDAFNVIADKSEIIFEFYDKSIISNIAQSLCTFYGEETNFEIIEI